MIVIKKKLFLKFTDLTMAEETAVDEDYGSYWDEFKLRTDEKEKTVEFLKQFKSCNWSEITSMLSIGAGE